MDAPAARVRPVIQARSSSVFTVLRGVGLLLAMFAVLSLGGAAGVHDSTGEAGGLVFLVVSGGLGGFGLYRGPEHQMNRSSGSRRHGRPFGWCPTLPAQRTRRDTDALALVSGPRHGLLGVPNPRLSSAR